MTLLILSSPGSGLGLGPGSGFRGLKAGLEKLASPSPQGPAQARALSPSPARTSLIWIRAMHTFPTQRNALEASRVIILVLKAMASESEGAAVMTTSWQI